MNETPPDIPVISQKAAEWQDTLNGLRDLYREVQRSNMAMPSVSCYPLIIYFWSLIKFYFSLILDIFLILPLNIVILIRNFFPGRWKHKSFSWKYFKYIGYWIWRGEFLIPMIYIRSLTGMLLRAHFCKNLLLIRRHVSLDGNISEPERSNLIASLNQIYEQWKIPSFSFVFFTYVIPTFTAIFELSRVFGLNDYIDMEAMPYWVKIATNMLVIYSLFVLGTCFLVKRSLMLGADGRALYFPGNLEGNIHYKKEQDILTSVGLNVRELPLDILFWALIIGVYLLGIDLMMEWQRELFDAQIQYQAQIMCGGASVNSLCVRRFVYSMKDLLDNIEYLLPAALTLWVMLGGLAVYRRVATERM